MDLDDEDQLGETTGGRRPLKTCGWLGEGGKGLPQAGRLCHWPFPLPQAPTPNPLRLFLAGEVEAGGLAFPGPYAGWVGVLGEA